MIQAAASLKDTKAKRRNMRFLCMRCEVLTTTVANLPVANRGHRLGHAELQPCNVACKQPIFFFTVLRFTRAHFLGSWSSCESTWFQAARKSKAFIEWRRESCFV